MNRFTFLFILLLNYSLSLSQGNKYTISNGDWHDPNVWSPNGVPTNMVDSIFVNHQISFGTDIVILGPDYLYVGPNACVFSSTVNNNFSYVGNGTLISYGNFYVNSFSTQVAFSEFHGHINASYLISFFGETIHQFGSTYKCEYFLNKSRMTFYGNAKCDYFQSQQFMTGNGKICIQDSLKNTDTITGPLNFGDATPSGPGDINSGYIAPSVNITNQLSCNTSIVSCQGMGVAKLEENKIYAYPNPVQDIIYFSQNLNDFSYSIFDLSGKAIQSGIIRNNSLPLYIPAKGMYFLKLDNFSQVLIKN